MKPNELRIGNYVSLLGNDVQIECISKLPTRNDMYWLKCVNYVDTKIIHFTPIELNKDWLNKFKLNSYQGIEIERCGFICMEGNALYIMDCNNPAFNRAFKKEVNYVHELQNIYFSLTGEELTIKT